MWTTHFHFFVQQKMWKNFKSILTSNRKTLLLHLKLNKLVHCHFQTLKQAVRTTSFVTSVYQKPTFSGVFTNFESFISKSYVV